MNKAIFLDRDGVINVDKGYVYKIEDFEVTKGITDFLRFCKKKGFLVIVITNQSGIARDYYTIEDYKKLTSYIYKFFENENISIDEIFFCPHHPLYSIKCNCRKPNTGLLEKAIKKYNIDISNSFLIGDKETDVEAGLNIGITKNILFTGKKNIKSKAQYVQNDLREIKRIICTEK